MLLCVRNKFKKQPLLCTYPEEYRLPNTTLQENNETNLLSFFHSTPNIRSRMNTYHTRARIHTTLAHEYYKIPRVRRQLRFRGRSKVSRKTKIAVRRAVYGDLPEKKRRQASPSTTTKKSPNSAGVRITELYPALFLFMSIFVDIFGCIFIRFCIDSECRCLDFM